MLMHLYHGSQNRIEKPIFGFGKPYNDYGLGFYCTESIDMAKEWSVTAMQNGYANCYTLDCSNLNVLHLNDGQYIILHWITILLQNRTFTTSTPLAIEAKQYLLDNFSIDYASYDIIIGYRADDSYFSFAQDFLNGTISYRQLSNAMHLGKLGEQVVLKSKKAFDFMQFEKAITVNKDSWYSKKRERDMNARREYFDVERNHRQRGDIYITHILDEEMKPDDARLR